MAWAICPDADVITQGYGCTEYASEWLDPNCKPVSPDDNRGHRHTGIDFGHTGGGQFLFRHPVYATRNGVVVAVGSDGQQDQWFSHYLGPQAVCVRMEDGKYLLLGHLDEARVTRGQLVPVGKPLGLVGTRGNSTAPHLHVEVRTDGAFQTPFNSIDPTPYLQTQGGFRMDPDVNLALRIIGLTAGVAAKGAALNDAELISGAKSIQTDFGNLGSAVESYAAHHPAPGPRVTLPSTGGPLTISLTGTATPK